MSENEELEGETGEMSELDQRLVPGKERGRSSSTVVRSHEGSARPSGILAAKAGCEWSLWLPVWDLP